MPKLQKFSRILHSVAEVVREARKYIVLIQDTHVKFRNYSHKVWLYNRTFVSGTLLSTSSGSSAGHTAVGKSDQVRLVTF